MEIYLQELGNVIDDIIYEKHLEGDIKGLIFILPRGSSYFDSNEFKSSRYKVKLKYIDPREYETFINKNDKESYRSFTKYLYEQLKEKSLIMHYEDYEKVFNPYQIDGDLFNGKINWEHFNECLKFLYYAFGKEGISSSDLLKEVDKISNFLYFKLVG